MNEEIHQPPPSEKRYISHEEEAPQEKPEELFSDPEARNYIASLLNTSHREEFEKTSTVNGAEGVIHQELSNLTGMISLWLGLYEKAPQKSSERAQGLLDKVKGLESKIAELTTAKYLLDKPSVLLLFRNSKLKPVKPDELL